MSVCCCCHPCCHRCHGWHYYPQWVPYVPYVPAPLPRPRWPDLIDRVQRYKPVVQRPNLI